MPRGPRKMSATGIYHIITRGIGQQIIFLSDYDRHYYIQIMHEIAVEEDVDLLAWCLMNNHVHILVHAQLAPSQMMKRMNTKYALFFNHKYDRVGPLFQDRFKSEIVETSEYLKTVARYIHRNPVMAGITDSCAEYNWSSYWEYLTSPTTCNTEIILGEFHSIAAFKQFHENECTEQPARTPLEATPVRLTDSRALQIILGLIDESRLMQLKDLKGMERKSILLQLKNAGLNCRQLARLTGISCSTIASDLHETSHH